jgi:aryl-alcohol dehydrogenase (NADP+)
MMMRTLESTDLEVFPLCLGGNVFGWTADEPVSFAVLDAYVEAGGNFVDTADAYCDWVENSAGGDSEAILGRWMASRGSRDQLVIGTKVGQCTGLEGLARSNIRRAAEASLRRLGTDRIDIYYAHIDDASTPLEETLSAFDELVREGKVRYLAASNYTAPRLVEALEVAQRNGLARYVALQPHYNLVHRHEFEEELMSVCARAGMSTLPYAALADGFLTGKYRPGTDIPPSERAEDAMVYVNDRGIRIIETLDQIADSHGVSVAAVALAWLSAQPTVAAPIASARTVEQLTALLPGVELELSQSERNRLEATSEPRG